MRIITLALVCAVLMSLQDAPLERRVMRKHDNGKDHVVMFFETPTGALSREEVYFPSGKLQWEGGYRKNVEHGTWKYYHENGKLKTEETYNLGREDGPSIQYDQNGKKVKEEI
ncbi:MAG: toxin-antitoxin system YwqK family antitoxin, partial [Flavobacteriales bacterium]